jgi:DNA-binding NtrC family response regulator
LITSEQRLMAEIVSPVGMTPTNAFQGALAKSRAAGSESPPSSDKVTILIADDEPLARRSLQQCLANAGYDLLVAVDGKQAQELMRDDVMVAVLDLNMPQASGMDCLEFIRGRFSLTPTIIVSGQNEIKDAVATLKAGACDYVTKPFESDELLACVAQAVRGARLAREHRGLKQIVAHPLTADAYLAKSKAGLKLRRQISRLAPLDSTVLITGESGTGKSTIARLIHQQGPRAEGPFVTVNCASLPRDLIEAELFGHAKGAFTGAVSDRPGRAEIADQGTLFLDEIGDLPLELQPKLLTFLQDRTMQRIGSNKEIKVDVRVITATHQDVTAMCQQGQFRQDLFYRLNVLSLHAAALRERSADIAGLAEEILQRIAQRRGTEPLPLSVAAVELLCSHDWPGNIRELENVLERATAFADGPVINAEHIAIQRLVSARTVPRPSTDAKPESLAGKTLAETERQAILETLAACGGNKALTARQLGISEKSIYNKMRRLGISGKK